MAKNEDDFTPELISESHFNMDADNNTSLKKADDLEKNNRVLINPEPPVMTAQMEEDLIHRKDAADLYYERDDNKWFLQIDSKNLKQQACQPKGCESIMFRARSNVKSHPSIIPKLIADMNVRKRWETQLYNM